MNAEIFTHEFLQNALIASLLASIVCGIIGVIIVERKMVMIGGGIAHTAYGGVGLGYLVGFPPMLGAFLVAILAAFGIGFTKRREKVQTDVMIALFWSLGMALGIVFIGLVPGYPPNMNSYLFGNILSVTRTELLLMLGLTVLVVFVVVILFQDLKAFMFDVQFAVIRGIQTTFLEYLLLVLIAITVVVLIRVAGIILVIALLAAPAASASFLSHNLIKRMILATIFGIAFCWAGLMMSYHLNIESGAFIVILAVVCYAVLYAKTLLKKNHKNN
ncbi:MAG TPA: metal ABC transporter permease [Methanocorpusculum sp.]|nr:metal ABC transporter permease [Methanocorpusculum sp.]